MVTSDPTRDDFSSTFFMTNEIASRIPWSLRLLYPVVQMSVGALLVGLVLDLSVLADNCDVSTSTASWALVVIGLGVLCSMIFVLYFASNYHAHDSIPLALLALSIITLSVPFISSIYLLCIITFLIGFLENVILSELYNLTRKIFGPDAGPWCTLNQLSFAFGGVIGTILNIISYELDRDNEDDKITTCINCSPWFFISVAMIMVILSSIFTVVRDPEGIDIQNSHGENSGHTLLYIHPVDSNNGQVNTIDESAMLAAEHCERGHVSAPHYYVEIILAIVLLAYTGGEYTLLSYLTTFAVDIDIESYDSAYYQATVSWFLVFVGMILAILDQSRELPDGHEHPVVKQPESSSPWSIPNIFSAVTNDTLPAKIMFCLFIDGLCMFAFTLPWIRQSKVAFWISTCIFSVFNGPIFGYSMDWLNRATYATEYSTGIAMTGVNAGASAGILFTLLCWYGLGMGVWSVIYVAGAMTWIVIPLVWYSRYLSYRVEVNPSLLTGSDNIRERYQYMPIGSSAGGKHNRPI